MVSEESRSCGQRGRVCRVFWRADVPWVLVRLPDGVMQSVPWAWTDLPVFDGQADAPVDESDTMLLSPIALRDLVRVLRELRERCRHPSGVR
jgi:hypothetical protein